MPYKYVSFSELSSNPKDLSLRKLAAADPKPLSDEAQIVHYLKYSPVIAAAPELWGDILDPTMPDIGGNYTYTDGEWSWSSQVIYYFEKYHVGLPEEFLEHIRKAYYQPIAVSENELEELANEFLGGGK